MTANRDKVSFEGGRNVLNLGCIVVLTVDLLKISDLYVDNEQILWYLT